MAVPSSGALSMRGLAREKVYDNYSSTSTPAAPYSMYDLVNGGNTNGSGVSFDATNTDSPDYPDTSAPHKMSEWYGYDHDYNPIYGPFTVYFGDTANAACSNTTISRSMWTTGGTPSDYRINDVYAWSNSGATSPLGSGWYKLGSYAYGVNSSGIIYSRYTCT